MAFLPVDQAGLAERGWDEADFIVVSGDAYCDHHSFGHAVISRLVEAEGFRCGVLPQPVTEEDYRALGAPKHAFLVSSGVVDSMVNNYTAAKRKRSTDEYSPGGRAGRRPDRALSVYCKTLKRLYPNVPVLCGGIEASLRRFAHYDYWSDSVMPSVLVSAPADLLIYGMGERPIREILAYVRRGVPVTKVRDVPGTAYLAKEEELSKRVRAALSGEDQKEFSVLPSFEETVKDPRAFCRAFRTESRNTDAKSGIGLIQEQAPGTYLVQNRPQLPLTEAELDAVFELPYENRPHPMYDALGGIPAIEEVRFSLVSQRGCFGSCSFCALQYHQGRVIQKRSEGSVLREAERMTRDPAFKGYIHDVGGPTANFRNPACDKQASSGACQSKYCIGSAPCKNLKVSHKEYLALLQKLRKLPGVKRVFVRSGIRFDYIQYDEDPQFLNELVKYHISGQLKIAPEHISDRVLKVMNKPPARVYLEFAERYRQLNDKYGLKQYLVPYFISSHPGSRLEDAVELACYLHSIHYMPQQVQDFYPTPSTRATCMFHTGLDPDTLQEVYVPKSPEEKAMQRALLQYRKKENYAVVKRALRACGREDLIGFTKNCLIRPTREEAAHRGADAKRGGRAERRREK